MPERFVVNVGIRWRNRGNHKFVLSSRRRLAKVVTEGDRICMSTERNEITKSDTLNVKRSSESSKTVLQNDHQTVTNNLVKLPTGAVLEVIEQLASPKPTQNFADSSLQSATPDKKNTIEAVETNSSDSVALLFIHGSKHGAWAYEFFQDYFSKHGWDTYAVSLRHAGKSFTTEEEQSNGERREREKQKVQYIKVGASTFIDDLRLLRTTYAPLKNRRLVVFGHSLGGYIVQRWLLEEITEWSKHDDKLDRREDVAWIAGQVLLASVPPEGNGSLVWRVLLSQGIRMSWMVTRALATDALGKDTQLCRETLFGQAKSEKCGGMEMVSDEKLEEYMNRFASNRLVMNIRTVTPLSIDGTRFKNTGIAVNEIVPTLSVGGHEDVIVDSKAVQDIAEFWQGESKMIHHAPHDLMLHKQWLKVAECVREWLDSNVAK